MIRGLKKTGFCVLFLFGTLLGTHLHSWSSSDAADHTESKTDPQTKSWHEKIETEWGGHLKARGSASHFDHESVFAPVGTGTYYDGNLEGRLKNRLFFADWGYFETHYEAVLSGGDTRSKTKDLETLFPVLFEFVLLKILAVFSLDMISLILKLYSILLLIVLVFRFFSLLFLL